MDSQTGAKKPEELSAEGFKRMKAGDRDAALKLFKKAYEQYVRDGDIKNQALMLQSISEIYRLTNSIDDAIETCEDLAAIYKQSGNQEQMFRVLNNIGLLEIGRKRYERALSSFNNAMELSEKLDNKNCKALQLGNIGSTYRDMNKSEEAISYYEKALLLYEESGDREGIADQHTNIAYIHVVEKRFEKALEQYRRALTLYMKTGNKDKARLTAQNIEKLEAVINK